MNRYLFAIIIAVIFIRCTKENSSDFFSDPNNPLNDTVWTKTIDADAPVNNIFQALAPTSQLNQVDGNVGGNINFPDNVQINFPANAFGGGVHGNLKVELDYLKTKGDMIRFGKPTTSEGKFLVSGGAFHLKV